MLARRIIALCLSAARHITSAVKQYGREETTTNSAATMLPSTSTEERSCNVMKATFLKQYYDKEEARAREPPPRVKRGKFVFREFESKDGHRRYDIGPRDPVAQAKIEKGRRHVGGNGMRSSDVNTSRIVG